jgi:GT2 family glycosyltransferase
MTPKTALLIPCYNAERYLPSLKRQIENLKPAFDEVLLVDDGSTDRTVERGRELGLKIEPLGTNRGPGAARNAAAKRTNAEWIHFHDADDELHANYLEKTLPMARVDVDVVLSSSDFVQETDRRFIMRWSFDADAWSQNPMAEAVRTGVNTTSSLIRKTKFDEIGGFNEEKRCWEDGDMHLRLALAGARFMTVPDVLCTSLRHSRGTSGNRLYCHHCRLAFLREYTKNVPTIPAIDLLTEIIKTATWLNEEGDSNGVNESLNLALKMGWKGPVTKNFILAFLNIIPFSYWKKILFFLQIKIQTSRKSKKILTNRYYKKNI